MEFIFWFMKQIVQTGSILIVGLGASAVAAYFYTRQVNKSDNTYKELAAIRKRISKCYSKCQVLCPLHVEQEISKNEQGITFVLKVITTLAQKPQALEITKKNPFQKPFEKGLLVQKLGESHNLLLNKFPVHPNHTIVSTQEFQAQGNPNTIQDLYQTYKVVKAVQGFGFFNSSPEAGSSQPHKHLQVLPESALLESDILKIITRFLKHDASPDKIQRCYRLRIYQNINHFIRPIEQQKDDILGSHLYEQYLNLLKDATGKQFITNESVVSLKYNLIMTTSFIMLIERKKEKFNDSISINAVGFTGSILVKTHHQLKALEDVRIVKMLEDVCQGPSDDSLGIFTWI